MARSHRSFVPRRRLVSRFAIATLFAVGATVGLAASSSARVTYDDGLDLSSGDGTVTAHIDWRAQLRYSTTESDEHPPAGEIIDSESELDLNRARFKLGGHVGDARYAYYLEYDLVGTRLLDLRLMLQPIPELGLRFGQYKVLYNRERVDSSGKQQFVERSIATRPFTLDRQQGGMVVGHLFAGTRADSRYSVGVFAGNGRDGGTDDDGRPMFVARVQWNLLGRDLGFSQSDIGRRAEPAMSLAIAAASNRSAYTRFSSDGGGQLDGFEPGEPGQYETRQTMVEIGHQFRGLSVQGELHWKEIDDRKADARTELAGGYLQAGYFFSERFARFPRPLELAARYARVHREGDRSRSEQEATVGANWFFHGHRNKLTADLAYLSNLASGDEYDSGWRFRLQWDVSF